MNKQEKGAFLIARSLLGSDIWTMPPYYVKIWLWLIAKANYKDGSRLQRGECIITIEETRQQTKYMVGYRSEMESTKTVRRVYEWLYERSMITTTKVTNGTLVKVLQYERYQTFENNEGTYESPTKVLTKDQRRSSEGQNISNKGNKEQRTNTTEFAEGSLELVSAKRFYELLLVNVPTMRKPNFQKWAKDFDLLYRVHKRDKELVKKIIAFALSDDFWKKNILSPAKLREKFDQLTAQAGDFVIEFDHSKEPFKLQVTDWNSKWGLTDKEFRAKHATGEIYPYLKDWYRKNGQGTSEFEKSNNINQ